jgi:hypothetical protein
VTWVCKWPEYKSRSQPLVERRGLDCLVERASCKIRGLNQCNNSDASQVLLLAL